MTIPHARPSPRARCSTPHTSLFDEPARFAHHPFVLTDQAPQEPSWIRAAAELSSLEPDLEAAPWIAADTESNSMFVYREQVCLMQLNLGGALWLVDTLALKSEDVSSSALARALESPDVPVYLHGGEYDVACLKREYQLGVRGVFDTQQAAAFLGMPRTGYGALVEAATGVVLAKGHAQYDWGTRPIESKALQYAIDDVVHLPDVVEWIRERVRDADLEEEVAIACAAVEEMEPHSVEVNPLKLLRHKHAKGLDPTAQAVLVRLGMWRDTNAMRFNKPPGRLVSTEVLARVARAQPADLAALKRCKVGPRIERRFGRSLVAAVEDGLENPPEVRRDAGARPPQMVRQRADRLRTWRRGEAEQRGVPPVVVLPPRALEYLSEHGAGDLSAAPQLGEKRAARYGDALRRACE